MKILSEKEIMNIFDILPKNAKPAYLRCERTDCVKWYIYDAKVQYLEVIQDILFSSMSEFLQKQNIYLRTKASDSVFWLNSNGYPLPFKPQCYNHPLQALQYGCVEASKFI